METELNASGYIYNTINYEAELQRILCGVFACYTMMLHDNIQVHNDENEIRNNLLIKYLKNDATRDITKLSDFLFDREVPEDNTEGRTDIKVQTKNTFIKTDAYYIIECKRLDNKNKTGISGLNAQYIKNGIYRFVSKYYSVFYRVNAMIGFIVEKLDIPSNIANINNLLQNHFNNCNTTRYIQTESFISDFEYHYSSEHNDIDNNIFTLYHLMLDFSENIKY
jgi:hypothetical protein